MLAEISMALTSLRAASDIVKGLNAANTQALLNDVKIGLQNHILDAQRALNSANEAQAASSQRIRHLEQEIAKLSNWEAEKQRHQLKDIGLGKRAYVLKPEFQTSEIEMLYCANCFEQSKKRPLQLEKYRVGRASAYVCHDCGSTLYVSGHHDPSHKTGFGK